MYQISCPQMHRTHATLCFFGKTSIEYHFFLMQLGIPFKLSFLTDISVLCVSFCQPDSHLTCTYNYITRDTVFSKGNFKLKFCSFFPLRFVCAKINLFFDILTTLLDVYCCLKTHSTWSVLVLVQVFFKTNVIKRIK